MKTKKLLFIFCCYFLLIQTINAQVPTLWGLASGGGTNSLGTVLKINGDGTGFSNPHQFGQLLYPGANPGGKLVRATNGKYYGLASTAGANSDGVLFSYDSASATYTDLYNFDGTHGATPLGSLIQATNGILYGTASSGGTSNEGVIFTFDPSTSIYTDRYNFNGTNGSNPQASLLQASNSTIYGTAENGGSNSAGVIFSFNASTYAYSDIHDFDVLNGSNPTGDLIQASSGLLYGMAQNGGSGNGVIFSYNYSTSTYAVTQILNSNSGFTPNGNLLNVSGILYGMTAGGGYGYGVIYKYDPSGAGTYTVLHNFNNTDGANQQNQSNRITNSWLNDPPYFNEGEGGLIKATDGKLYGMTNIGGVNNDGVIFSIDPTTLTYTKLYDFNNGVSGIYPLGSLFQASDGLLYGMTSEGDAGSGFNYGTIFSYDISGGGFTLLHEFDADNSNEGGYPLGSFIEPTAGKLYATAPIGGNEYNGVIFSWDISGSTYSNEYIFNQYSIDAYLPLGSLVEAGGLLYGTTGLGDGGSGNNMGCVFSFDMSKTGGPDNEGFTPLGDFDGTSNGSTPEGTLYYSSSDGLLYGTTDFGDGGSGNNHGTIFSLDPSGPTLTSLYDFDPSSGNSVTSVIEISPGSNLYGTSPIGGTFSKGFVFSFDRSSSITNKYSFGASNGTAAHPYGGLVQASNGILYGVASSGGSSNNGVLLSFNPTGSVYNEPYSFDGTNGANPRGNLIQESNGLLYGLSSSGGSTGNGTLFSFNYSSTTFADLYDFGKGNNGNNPYGSLMKASNNRLYGMTYNGGGANGGTLFSYDISSPSYNLLLDFKGTNGAAPNGALIKASNGLLYGMTSSGGLYGYGVIFSIDPVALTYTELVTFNGAGNGATPNGNLFQANNGKLYGLAQTGGANGKGVMFSYDLTTSTYAKLIDFNGSTNGSLISYDNGLMQAIDGKLYGTTYYGNTSYGNIFSYDPTTSTFTNEYDFVNEPSVGLHVHGGYPSGTPIQLSDGFLYGIVLGGGSVGNGEAGAIYRYNIATHKDTLIHSFDIENVGGGGGQSFSKLIQASNGLLYGLCRLGLNNGSSSTVFGTLFSIDPTNITNPNPTYAARVSFDNISKGLFPYGSAMQASDDSIYGMTNSGGTHNSGVIFKYSYNGSGSYHKLRDLATADGTNPLYTNFVEIALPSNPTISVNTPSAYCNGSGNAALTASCNTNCTGITYTWAPNTNLSATSGASVTATPTITTTYTVTGTNGSGGTATATSVVTVNATPSAPVATAGTAATNTQITANWNTVSGATGYFLDVATDIGFSSFVTGFNNLNVGNVLTKNVTGLSSGTTYYYRVRATNGTCTSTNSNTITYATTGAGASCPFTGGAVTKPFTIICSGNTTTLTVTGSTGNNYNWQISSDNINWSDISGATTTSYTTAGGDGTTNKFYRLMSKSIDCYNVTSTTAEVDVSNPTIVITTSNITDNSVTLNWGPTGSGNYTISYSGPTSATLTSVTPPKTITGLTSGGTYNVTVTQTGLGCSASGTITGVTTLCAMPTGVTLSSPANGQILVSWTGVGGADYRVYYRPLFSYNTYFTKDVSNVSSVLLTKQGNNNLYASTTYEVYVSRLDCPTTGATGQPTNPANVTTLPNVSCATPVIDSVRSLCPVQIEVFIHDNGVNQYSVFMQRITPTILAVNSYGISGTYFTINTPYSGDQYLIAIEAKCGGALSNLYVWPGSLSIKPLCSAPANLVLSNPTCHGFTASWNADQCLSNSASEYDLSLRIAGTINYNSYGVSLPGGGLNPNKVISFATPGRAYQVFVRSIYNCNGFVTYGPSSQVQTISTLSSGCRDEETDQAEETKPAVQQYSPDNSEVFSLYPNPNNGEFAVNLSRLGNEEDAVRIEVINMIGQTVVTHLTTISGGQMSEFINLPTGTAAGTYIVRLTAGKNVYTAKVNVSK